MRKLKRCGFRTNVRGKGRAQTAECRLLEQLTGLEGPGLCNVRRDACEACASSFQPSPEEINPVIASLLFRLSTGIIAQGGILGCHKRKAARLRAFAEASVAGCLVEHPGGVRCDVVVCCPDSSALTDRAVRSALEQDGANVSVHLVDDGGAAAEILARYGNHRNVVLHRNSTPQGTFATLHDLIPALESEFVAVQDPRTISHRERIRASVGILAEQGADVAGASLDTRSGEIRAEPPGREFRRYIPPQTLVFRRASLVDIGGFANRRFDADVELLFRATLQGWKVALLRAPTVTDLGGSGEGPAGVAPPYQQQPGSLRHHGRGFPERPVECDVVLPFRDHVHYLRQAVPGVLEQEGAEVVLHLIDDASTSGAEEVLRYWSTHPQVRTYRNVRNLGQFISFNNIFPYLETQLVAVQDADDISLPHRLHRAGNLLRLANADIFGGRARVFDDEPEPGPIRHEEMPGPEEQHAGPEQSSRYPRSGERGYFLLNPTAVMRVGTFERLAGFSDYGEPERNKCGLDTEFYVRAHCAAARFAVSREVVLNYRRHPNSATRNARTGWGSSPRAWTENENQRRFNILHGAQLEPSAFGALSNHWGLTLRLGRL
jgi:glycosyltransferase involved in cell wall biosynthesis